MESGRESQPRRGARGQGRPVRRERIVPNPKLKLMDQVREVLRLKHYSIPESLAKERIAWRTSGGSREVIKFAAAGRWLGCP